MLNPLDFLSHFDRHLLELVNNYGTYSYFVLFAIIFLEMGVVAFPFLPGDSLLFTLGGLMSSSSHTLNLPVLSCLLISAAFLGYQVNYRIGYHLGRYIIAKQFKWFKAEHLKKAHDFYERKGGIALFYGRFLPIIRTFVPFVAGLGRMNRRSFLLINLVSAIIWVMTMLGLGYFLGSQPLIKAHFSWVIYGIILLSGLPFLMSLWHDRAV